MNLPQTPVELMIGQLEWAHKNINNNLDFVPSDKLDWKPAPEAKSVLEIINHATGTVNFFTSQLTGNTPAELTPVTNTAEAKALITQVVQQHISALKALTPDELPQIVKLPFGEFPKGFIAGLPVVELINHHGQITYIQELLGDSESHLLLS